MNQDTTAAADAAAAASTAAKKLKQVKARVIFAGQLGKIDDVVVLDEAVAKAGVAAGEIDTDKGAVAYAEGLAKPAA